LNTCSGRAKIRPTDLHPRAEDAGTVAGRFDAEEPARGPPGLATPSPEASSSKMRRPFSRRLKRHDVDGALAFATNDLNAWAREGGR
jgi:hypothetical protein